MYTPYRRFAPTLIDVLGHTRGELVGLIYELHDGESAPFGLNLYQS